MKNFIFISPHFPVNYRNFCIKLHENGVNVLGIGDAPYDSLDYMLQGALTEYYRVNNMENYDEMYRAVAFFCFKYGKIDGLESNNEYEAGNTLLYKEQVRHEKILCAGRGAFRPLSPGDRSRTESDLYR